ncbi:copper resistance CopC family protein [uncultured Arthrobacter sp.]|uniref:copper resistance CopC family protein n=1 Tax=uncultured Arthrobacter sp. TaxID=114050 RepID=UPI0026049B5C|nr:copper resistance CopC family protein [uncultured Arthrobacter sp.]
MTQYSAVVAARPAALSGARSFQRIAAVLAGVLMIAFALVVGPANTASAHEELSSSSPEPGATLETVPGAVELTFTNVPATIGSEVQVLDAEGEDWAEGDVSITDTVATQAIRAGAPAGTYTVNWRVVSSDSHPIEGTFEFTASDGGTTSDAPAASGTPEASVGTAGPIETADPGALDQEPAADSGLSWGVILMIAVLIALAIVLALGARRRLKQGSNDAA